MNNMDSFPKIEIEGLDAIDILLLVTRKKKKFLAMLLSELETTYPRNTEEYKVLRKLILDYFNDYTRSIMRALFGDIEGLIMK